MKLCECGCGLPSPVATHTSAKYGRVKGEQTRFVVGHALKGKPSYARPSIEERFWSKVNKHGPNLMPSLGPCWVWTGAKDKDGYGVIHFKGALRKAHRVAWFLATGEWPEPNGLHKCDNKPCVRFSHMYEGDTANNAQDREARGEKRQREKGRYA